MTTVQEKFQNITGGCIHPIFLKHQVEDLEHRLWVINLQHPEDVEEIQELNQLIDYFKTKINQLGNTK